MQKKPFSCALMALAVAALSACGGGGGSAGVNDRWDYQIFLESNKSELPTNTGNFLPNFGFYASHTATMTVKVTRSDGGDVPPSSGEPIGCGIARGLDSVGLFYLDGRDGEIEEVLDNNGNIIIIPRAKRNIDLPIGPGGISTFHVHSDNLIANEAEITCTIRNPRDQSVKKDSRIIRIINRNGMPARTVFSRENMVNRLGTVGNLLNLPNTIQVSGRVTDDRELPVASNGRPNLRVSILRSSADDPGMTASLAYADQPFSDEILASSAADGMVQFTLRSGPVEGPVLLRMLGDRCDNDVSNGTPDDCAVGALAVAYTHGVRPDETGPLRVRNDTLADDGVLTRGEPTKISIPTNTNVWMLLHARGGVPPYTWTIPDPRQMIPSLPSGRMLTVSPEGIFSGRMSDLPVPNVPHYFDLIITDDTGVSIRRTFEISFTSR